MSDEERGRGPRKSSVRRQAAQLEELVRAAKTGDVEAFRQLYETFGERILNYVYRLTGSREDAEDLTQETFVLAYRKLGTLKDDGKIQSWLYRIAQNNVFQKYRTKTPQLESIDQDDGLELADVQKMSTPSKSPEESTLVGELEVVVEKVIQALPSKYREVFVLSAVQKLSYREISEIVGRSLASVKSDIHRARVVVRDEIRQYLGENYGMSKPF